MKEISSPVYPSKDKPWLKYYTEEQLSVPLPECTLYEMIWENNKDSLDRIAIDYFGNKVTYKQMFENIDMAAKAYAAAGVKDGDIVIVSSVTIPELIYSVYALNRLGAVPNMVDPRTSTEGIRDYILEVKATLAVTIDVAYPRIARASEGTPVEKIISISPSDSMPAVLKGVMKLKAALEANKPVNDIPVQNWKSFIKDGKDVSYSPVAYTPKKCCVIVHTGGTTGMPKGVMLSNDNINAVYSQAKNSPLKVKSGDKFLNIMPPFIAYGFSLGLHLVLSWGLTEIIIPKFDPESFDKLIIKHKPNALIGVPSYFDNLRNCKKLENYDLSFIKVLLSGGDKTQPEVEDRINTFFKEHNADILLSKGYSMTECSAMGTISYDNINKLGTVGIPMPKTTISIFEEGTDRELSCGEIGEICMQSPTMMIGYYNNQEATDALLRTHSDGLKWAHTGDLGYLDVDGMVHVEGRLKRMIIRHDGFKVFPPFIEDVVVTHPAIENCCVVAQKDRVHGVGAMPFVFCTLKDGVSTEEEQIISELKDICLDEIPEYSQPVGYKFVSQLPLTPIGKVDYRALEEELNAL